MTTLYSCKHAGDEYRITKFDDDMNVVSSYLCNHLACDCPAGVRDTCRHRQMLPKFLARSAVGTAWFLDYDRNGWVQTDLGEALSESVYGPDFEFDNTQMAGGVIAGTTGEANHAGRMDIAGTATASMALPEGVVMVPLGNPQTLFNAIADAVGEPRSGLGTPPAKPFRRGL